MDYDLIIIGCGPAGMSAGIYAARLGLKTVIFEAKVHGGAMALAHIVENYPGFVSTSGQELADRMLEQVKKAGAEVIFEGIVAVERKGDVFEVTTNKNNKHVGKAVILATGGQYRKLGIEGEEEFLGRGVSYCPHCDGPLFKGKKVAVIGGGDTAVSGAVYLADIAEVVYVIHRRKEFRAENANVEKLKGKKNITLFLEYIPLSIHGDEVVKSLRIQSLPTGEKKEIAVDGVFICVGEIPLITLAESLGVKIGEKGEIVINEKGETNIKGVYAAGDVTGGYRQIITAAAQGVVAAINAYQYIKGKEMKGIIK